MTTAQPAPQQPPPPPLPYVMFDTGPLLGFGATPGGPALVQARYHGRAGKVTDIDRELAGLTRNSHPGVAKAAGVAASAFGWMDRIEVTDEAILRRGEELQARIQAFKKKPTAGGSRRDWGESITLAHAEQLASSRVVVVVANEDDVKDVSTRLRNRVNIATFVDVLKGMVRSGQLTPKDAYRAYRSAIDAGVDAGDVASGPNDFPR